MKYQHPEDLQEVVAAGETINPGAGFSNLLGIGSQIGKRDHQGAEF